MHRLIAKQIAKATGAAGAVDVDRLAELVSNAYEEFDRDRRRTDRSMSLMIEEVETVNRNLEQLVANRSAELRAREEWRSIPVIVLTARELAEKEREWLRGRVEAIVQKGALGRDALLAEVRRIVEKHRQDDVVKV